MYIFPGLGLENLFPVQTVLILVDETIYLMAATNFLIRKYSKLFLFSCMYLLVTPPPS